MIIINYTHDYLLLTPIYNKRSVAPLLPQCAEHSPPPPLVVPLCLAVSRVVTKRVTLKAHNVVAVGGVVFSRCAEVAGVHDAVLLRALLLAVSHLPTRVALHGDVLALERQCDGNIALHSTEEQYHSTLGNIQDTT